MENIVVLDVFRMVSMASSRSRVVRARVLGHFSR